MGRLFRTLGTFVVTNRRFVIIAALLMLVPCAIAAMNLDMATGLDTMVSTDTQAYQDYERFHQDFGSSVVVVLVSGDDVTQLLQPSALQSMDYVESQMQAQSRVISAVGPAYLIKQAVAQGTGVPALPEDLPTLLYVVTDPQTGQVRPEFQSVFPDEEHALIAVVLQGGLTLEQQSELVDVVLDAVDSAGFSGLEVLVTGEPAVMGQVEDLMLVNLGNMLTLSVFLMLLILALIFTVRGFFAWRWMPLGVVGIAIIYTFGAMGLMGMPLTMVSMAVFPILVGLGIDYAIQLHNRYDEEFGRNKTVAGAMVQAVTRIGPAIGIALIAGCLGFAALFFSPVPMIRDFGQMLIIGVAACYLLAVFFLSAVLSRRHRGAPPMSPQRKRRDMLKKERINIAIGVLAVCVGVVATFVLSDPSAVLPQDQADEAGFTLALTAAAGYLVAFIFLGAVLLRRRRRGRPAERSDGPNQKHHLHIMEKGIRRMAPMVLRSGIVIIPLAIALTVAGFVADSHVETETDEMQFISEDVPAIQDYLAMEEVSAGFISANLLVEANDVTEPAVLNWIVGVEQLIATEQADIIARTDSLGDLVMQATGGVIPPSSQQVKGVLDMLPQQTISNFVSEDFSAANVVLTLQGMTGDIDQEQLKGLKGQLEGYVAGPPAGVEVAVTGMPVIGVELMNAITGGRMQMTLIGVGLIFAGLLLMFRFNLLRALLCTLPVGLIIGWSSGFMFIAGLKFNPATATMGALIMGIGAEYTILLLTRYYEERGKGERPAVAMTTAMTRIGRAIGVSALTTVGGFAALLAAVDFPILKDFGIVTVVDVVLALMSTLLVLPPLVVWIDNRRQGRRRRVLVRRRA